MNKPYHHEQLVLNDRFAGLGLNTREMANAIAAPIDVTTYFGVLKEQYNPNHIRLLNDDIPKALRFLCAVSPLDLAQISEHGSAEKDGLTLQTECTWDVASLFGKQCIPKTRPEFSRLRAVSSDREAGITMTALCGYLSKKYPRHPVLGHTAPSLKLFNQQDTLTNVPSNYIIGPLKHLVPYDTDKIALVGIGYFRGLPKDPTNTNRRDTNQMTELNFMTDGLSLPEAAKVQAVAIRGYVLDDVDPVGLVENTYGRSLEQLEADWDTAMHQKNPVDVARYLLSA